MTLDTFSQDIRYALRTLGRNRGFTLIAVLVLGLGIGANTAIFSVTSAVLLRPLPFAEPDRLVVLWTDFTAVGGRPRGMPDAPTYVEWARQSRSFDALAAIVDISYALTGDGEPERLAASGTTANLFSLLGVKPLLGRTFTPDDGQPGASPVVVIGDRLWMRRFGGDPDVIGRSMVLEGARHTVIGVVRSDFRFPDENEIWVPLPPEELARHGNVFVVGRLADGVARSQAQAEMSSLARAVEQERGVANSGLRIAVVGLHEYLARNARPALFTLVGAVAIVLLIACANVANLLLARGAARVRELALRKALGAAGGRMLRQLLTESAVLAVGGVAVGIALAAGSFGYLARLVPNNLPGGTSPGPDWRVLVFTTVLTLGTVALFGAGPALAAARLDAADSLRKGAGRGATPRSGRLRDALVVAEIMLTVVLLAAGGLLLRSYAAVVTTDPGFTPQNLLVAQTFPSTTRYQDLATRTAFYRGVLERVNALPGVAGAGYVNYPPLLMLGGNWTITVEGRPEPAPTDAARYTPNARGVSADYLPTLGVPLIRGRHFDDRVDSADAPRSVLINETMARRLWPDGDPLGARLKLGDARSDLPWATVIGVVGDIRQTSLDAPPAPEMYFSVAQPPTNASFLWPRHLVVRTEGEPSALAAAVRNAVWETDPSQSVSWVRSMTEIVDNDLASRNAQLTLVGAFAVLALLLASVGLYGVLSYAVTQRNAEIGVRMALGAPRANVVRSVVRSALLLAVVGIALGLAGAFGLTRFLGSFLFDVSPNDPLTLAGVSVVILAVTALASYAPARRAAAVDPVTVLRAE